ncbi:AAA family ATPase [Pelagibacterium limicola]|uniref:AAA family ATPase n=1 Tax=Pelagibacterium limicola TaxID=2791022 RepID=UPI0018AF6C2B|nr:AAA family ATPase [Pelagibacterium limicola]
MTSKPKAFLLHGFLGAGKTTFAKRLEMDQDAVRFTHDEWMARLYGDDPPAELFQAYARRVSEVMEETWIRCLQLGTNVVLDFGFWSRAERRRVRAVAASHGAVAILYRLNCSEDVAWARIAERNKRLAGNLYVAPNTFQVLKARFEPLHEDEDRIEIGGEKPSTQQPARPGAHEPR